MPPAQAPERQKLCFILCGMLRIKVVLSTKWMFSAYGLKPPARSLRIFFPGWSSSSLSTYWKTVGPRVSKAILDEGKETQQPYVYVAKDKLILPSWYTSQ